MWFPPVEAVFPVQEKANAFFKKIYSVTILEK